MPSGTSLPAGWIVFVRRSTAAKNRLRALEVALARSLRHGAKRSHAAIRLEAAALVQNHLAGTFVGAGEQRSDHHRARAGGQGLGDVAGILDAAIGDDGNARVFGGAISFGDGGDLRHAGAGDHARGADGARPNAHFDAVRAGASQVAGAVKGGDVAGHQIHVRQLRLHQLDRLEHAGGVAVRAVDGQHVHLGFASSCARSRKSPVAPMAAPTRRRPCESLAALGYFSFF